MKDFRSLLPSFALVCLLAPAALAGDGTMTSGGDRMSPQPAPPPAESTTTQSAAESDAQLADTSESAPALAEAARLAFLQIASWIIWP